MTQKQAKTTPLEILWANAAEGLCKMDGSGRVLAVNQAFARLFGCRPEEARGRDAAEFFAEGRRGEFRRRLASCLKGSPKAAAAFAMERAGGQGAALQVRLAAYKTASTTAVFGFVSDPGQAAGALEELEVLRDSFGALSETVSDPILQINEGFKILFANSAVESVFGYPRKELLNQDVSMLFPKAVFERYREQIRKYFVVDMADRASSSLEHSLELLGQRKSRDVVPLELTFGNSKSHHGERALTCIIRDITQRKMAERKLRFLAYHDKLTELGNRDLFYITLNQLLNQVKRYRDTIGALLFLDLDGFKKVNDTLGHAVGDRVLCECARRLSSCLRESDQVYRFSSELEAGKSPAEDLFRFGGDEFVILLTHLSKPTDAAVVAQKIIQSVRQPFQLPGVADSERIAVGVSIGIALIPGDGTDPMSLIRSADVAMYKAKEQRSRFVFFTAELNQKANERVSLEAGLRDALENRHFRLYYQPIVNAFGAIEGAEALLRWQDGRGEFVPPSRFIPVAEETGMILPLGDWVLRQACEDLRKWNDGGFADFYVSVNLSVKQMGQEDVVAKLNSIIREARIRPSNLKVELTETTLMRDPPASRLKLEQIKAGNPGIRIAIDDFGTGYSSLAYLSEFPVDLLKIDRSFVANLKKEQNARIINAVMALARNLRLEVVAEGVETVDQYRYLSSQNCTSFQGFYFGKAMSAEELTALLRQSREAPQRGRE